MTSRETLNATVSRGPQGDQAGRSTGSLSTAVEGDNARKPYRSSVAGRILSRLKLPFHRKDSVMLVCSPLSGDSMFRGGASGRVKSRERCSIDATCCSKWPEMIRPPTFKPKAKMVDPAFRHVRGSAQGGRGRNRTCRSNVSKSSGSLFASDTPCVRTSTRWMSRTGSPGSTASKQLVRRRIRSGQSG